MTTLIRPDDVTLGRDEIVAATFLASYRGKTRELYATNLKIWFRWCERHGMRPLDASRAHIEVWARELEERDGNKLSTVANKLNTVCRYADARQVSYYDRDKDSLARNATHMVSAFVEGA